MSEQVSPITAESLKTEWAATKVEDANKPQEFSPNRWLGDFYDYYYTQKGHLANDEQLLQTVREVLTTTDATLQTATKSVAQGFEKLPVTPAKNKFAEVRDKIQASVQHVATRFKLEQLLSRLEQRTIQSTKPTVQEVTTANTDLQSIQYIESLAQQSEQLPQQLQEIVDQVTSINTERADLEENIIQAEVDEGNEDIVTSQQELHRVKTEFKSLVAPGSNIDALTDFLYKNQGIIHQLDETEKLQGIYELLPQLARMPVRERFSTKSQIQTSLQEILSPDTQRRFLINKLIATKKYDASIYETIDGVSSMYSCALRVGNLESLLETESLTPEQKQILYAACLEDLGSEISPTVLVDIINQKLTSQDLVEATLLDWLKTQDTLGKSVDPKDPNKLLARLTDILKKGTSILSLPLLLPLLLAKNISLPLLQKLLPNIGDAPASLDFQNPFEGVEHLSGKKLWEMHGLSTAHQSDYFRQGSAEKFDTVNCKWESTSKTVVIDQSTNSMNLDQHIRLGRIKGTPSRLRKGFYVVPVPYGSAVSIIHFVKRNGSDGNGLIDVRTDGSVGIDLDRPTYGSESGKERFNTSYYKSRRKQDIYYALDKRPLLEKYPIDIEQCLEPIIPSLDCLPEPVQGFITSLQAGSFSPKEMFDSTMRFVHDYGIYSLDPKNGSVYKEARKKGYEEFVRTIYDYKKWKCDGAATAAIGILRMLGIPSRIAVGYLSDLSSGDTEIRGEHAHGWVEARVGPELVFGDPTPENQDEITQKILARSSFINNLFKKLSIDTKFQDRYRAAYSDQTDITERVFSHASSSNDLTGFIRSHVRPPTRYKDRPHKSDLQAINDQLSKLHKVEQDLPDTPTFTQAVDLMQEHGALDEKMPFANRVVNDNAKTMFGQVFKSQFIDTLFKEGIVDPQFRERWSNKLKKLEITDTYGNIEHDDDPIQQWLKTSIRQINDEYGINNQGYNFRSGNDFNPDFITRLTEILRVNILSNAFTIAISRHPIDKLTISQSIYDELNQMRQKKQELITQDVVKNSYLPQLVESFALAAEAARRDNQTKNNP